MTNEQPPKFVHYILRNIPEELWRKLKVYAAANGTTMRELILDAIKKIVGKID